MFYADKTILSTPFNGPPLKTTFKPNPSFYRLVHCWKNTVFKHNAYINKLIYLPAHMNITSIASDVIRGLSCFGSMTMVSLKIITSI